MTTNQLKELADDVRRYIHARAGDVNDLEVREYLEQRVLEDPGYDGISIGDKIRAAETVFDRTRRDLSVLEPLAADEDVTEIMVNGPDDVFVERAGKLTRAGVRFESTGELEEVIRRIAAGVHREINERSPILDARLADGSRVHAVSKNIALGGPILTIRRFPKSRITMADLLAYGTLTEEAATFLETLVLCAYNIFISGGTSSGKTTFLNVLSNFIPKDERIVTIEDSAELQIREIANIVRLECRSANETGQGGISVRDLIKASLRMRPDRIIVGEVRGAEVLDMIQAMNTGHAGSLSTGHGNSPQGMLYRLEAMFLQAADFPVAAIRRQITEGIDILVHLGRLTGGRRAVREISEIAGITNGEITLNPLFTYQAGAGLVRTKSPLIHREKLRMKGMENDRL
ncbi:MAG: CpaF family protein [Clostridiales Family XIII bacterium]|jgi:pilus assembly protein CpaF|nr:CpaF family protein [Clostridiales Family XIII bacterium]